MSNRKNPPNNNNKIATLTEEVKLLRLLATCMDYGNDPQVACAHKTAHTEKLRPDAVTEFSTITSCQARILAPNSSDDFTQNVILMRLLESVSRLDDNVNSLTNKVTSSVPTGLGNNHINIPSWCCHTTCMHNDMNKTAPGPVDQIKYVYPNHGDQHRRSHQAYTIKINNY